VSGRHCHFVCCGHSAVEKASPNCRSGPVKLRNHRGSSVLLSQTMQSHASSESIRKVSEAGIIIIGDEILKGQTHDTNTFFLAGELYRLGIKGI
jgi:hypothetical protein